MNKFTQALKKFGKSLTVAPGEVIIRQGTMGDSIYYLESGRLGMYREEKNTFHYLSDIMPGEIVGEPAVRPGHVRSITVMAKEKSNIFMLPKEQFRKALNENPELAITLVFRLMDRLSESDVSRISLGRSFVLAQGRVKALYTEKERLKEMLRLREELADMIVHDLKNPLGLISGSLSILKHLMPSENQTDETDELFGTIERSVKRMLRLVETLLQMARFEEGKMHLDLQPIAVKEIIDQVIEDESILLEDDEISVRTEIPENLPRIKADQEILQRILFNLLDNAAKYTPTGENIVIEASDKNDYVEFHVMDKGPGVPPDERKRIFEKFTHLPGRKGARKGAGLGLAFCRMAVESHGGYIYVEDGPQGQGSRFVFSIPALRDAD